MATAVIATTATPVTAQPVILYLVRHMRLAHQIVSVIAATKVNSPLILTEIDG